MTNQYIPGDCNIGPAEIRRRYRIGYIGLAISVIWIVIVALFDLPSYMKLLIFFPLYYSLSGFIQARYKFCYVYGWQGLSSIGGRKTFTRTKDPEALAKDKKLSRKIVLQVLISSFLLTMVYFFLTR
jgi:hypothetical protein